MQGALHVENGNMSMKICFLVGSMNISGGTYVIVQHASHLRKVGHEVTLAVQEPFTNETLRWHDEAPKLRCVPIAAAKEERFDLVIATWWKTAFELADFDAGRYAYFVQSIESRFYPESELPLRGLVDATYHMPCAYVTEATWITRHLHTHFGQDAALVRNGIRKDVYTKQGSAVAPRPVTGQPRILVEGHFGVRFKNTALAIKLARKAGAKDIWLLTGSPLNWVPGVSTIFSRVPMVQTPTVYRSCDLLIKLSTVEGMFGPPLEMFHCGGTAVVFDVSGHDEYIRHGDNAIVVPTGDTERVVEEVADLLGNSDRLHALKQGALATAADWPSWEESSRAFADWILDAGSTMVFDRKDMAERTKAAFARYDAEERSRLIANPGITRRYKLSALAAKLPTGMKRRIKALEAAGEMIFGGNKVY
jgi:glycosyltransferase involved in cell wall biosynthesis